MSGTGGFLNPEQVIKQLNIDKGMQIADFGCGAGYFVIPMAKIVGDEGKIYALDVLDTALESVRSRAKIQGLFNIITRRCNLEVINGSQIENDSIDLVLLANILFQSENKIGIIKEASRVLKKRGRLVVIDWNENQPLGPSKDLFVPINQIEEIAMQNNFGSKHNISVDQYHWGLILTKN